ncbi:MAG: energy-coupling factor transporter transmembrane protein EcfT, partial [Clostridiales bacterium]|nr:energy-coupling factor transporter transmembrane protein EcfT [Clostridiales bacterium]
MIKDITIGQYIPGETFVHKLDPRTKILLTILYIISLFIVDKFVGYILIIGFL